MSDLRFFHVPEFDADFVRIHPELWHMRRILSHKEVTNHYDVIGRAWCFSVVYSPYLKAGYWQDGHYFMLNGWAALFLPPMSIVRWRLLSGLLAFDSFFSMSDLPQDLADGPLMIPIKHSYFPKDPKEIFQFVQAAENKQTISLCTKPNAIAERVKKTIDQTFNDSCEMGAIAQKIKVSATVLGRLFKKSYGLSPIQYLNYLRVREAMTTLLFSEQPITEIGLNAGFGDSSQINRNFNKYAGINPKQLHLSRLK